MKYLLATFAVLFLLGCNSGKLSETPMNQFIGTWRLEGRSLYENVEVKIGWKNDKLTGTILKLNDNKYVNLFMEEKDVFVSEIKRTSNFQFVLKEKKVAAELFAAYGNSGTQEFEVQFENKNTILLGKNGSSGKYIRMK